MANIEDMVFSELGSQSSSRLIADGPFVLSLNNQKTLAHGLGMDDDGYVVSGQGRAYVFNFTKFLVTVTQDGTVINFNGPNGRATISPMTLEDAEWAYPEFVFSNLEHFKDFTLQQLRLQFEGQDASMATQYGVTLDETNENVIDLIRMDDTGTFYRENNQWIALDLDDETDSAMIDDVNWQDVSEAAIAFFDENSTADRLTRDDILPYIVN